MKPEDVPVHLVVLVAMAMAGVIEDDMTVEQFVATERGRGWCGSARHALAAVLPLALAEERAGCIAAARQALEGYRGWDKELTPDRLMKPISFAIRSRGEPRDE